MPRRISSRRHPAKGVRSRIDSLLDEAIAELMRARATGDPAAVHEARKRCKETRALARLLGTRKPARAERFDTAVRDAGRAVAAMRDAQALTGTIASLATSTAGAAGDAIAGIHLAGSTAADRTGADADAAVDRAIDLLVTARAELDDWKVEKGFAPVAEGIEHSFRTARQRLGALRDHDDDRRLHEWRKAVKRLWYQLDVVSAMAPSALDPMVASLDTLSELLGDDHDLAVLIERLSDRAPGRGGAPGAGRDGSDDVVIGAARARQAVLRDQAMRLGATLLAESPRSFRRRLRSYRSLRRELGREPIHDG